jgi:hypothetical protein
VCGVGEDGVGAEVLVADPEVEAEGGAGGVWGGCRGERGEGGDEEGGGGRG